MKRKLALIIAMMTLAASLTACGGAKDTDAKSEKEPVVEQTVTDDEKESVVDSEKQVTDKKDIEEKFTEEASSEEVVSEMTYEVSAVMMPDDSAVEPVDFNSYLDWSFKDTSISMPYYTITNTSDKSYSLNIESDSSLGSYKDSNFEPNETITLAAFAHQKDDEKGYWMTIEESSDLLNYGTIEITEAIPETNRTQEMITIQFDSSKSNGDILSEISINENATNVSTDYVIFYDVDGNVITSAYLSYNMNRGFINVRDNGICDFSYPSVDYNMNTFTWASADIYYSYEVAAE